MILHFYSLMSIRMRILRNAAERPEPPPEFKSRGLKDSECRLLAKFIDVRNPARIFEGKVFHPFDTVPETNGSLLCSTTAWTIDWDSIVARLRAWVNAMRRPIDAMKDEI